MIPSFIILVVSLVLLGAFIVFKHFEFSRGRVSGMTHTLARFSPSVETVYDKVLERLRVLAIRARDAVSSFLFRVWRAVRAIFRHLVVLFAAKMVRAVKGEKLLYDNGAPSLYLKRLGVEMQSGDTLTPEDVREDVMRRVEINKSTDEPNVQ